MRLSDGYQDLAGQRFDVVLSNLPAHRGQQADSTVAHEFIAGAPAHLRAGGAAWFVANKARKTCPDCRIVVKDLPAPAYVVSQPAYNPSESI